MFDAKRIYIDCIMNIFVGRPLTHLWLLHLNFDAQSVGNNRSDEGTVTEKYEEEIDDEGFITVRTKKTKRELKKRSKQVTWKDIESEKCKSVSRAILLKQSS
jgi:hypothetical protein